MELKMGNGGKYCCEVEKCTFMLQSTSTATSLLDFSRSARGLEHLAGNDGRLLQAFWDEGKAAIPACHLYVHYFCVVVGCHGWQHLNLAADGLSPQQGSEGMGRDAKGKRDRKGLENEGESITHGSEHL